MKSNDDSSSLFLHRKNYNEQFCGHLLEQYKLCVMMADKTSDRRLQAHMFFIGINTILSALISLLKTDHVFLILIIAIIAISICLLWKKMIISYVKLNTVKFKIINQLEEKFLSIPFTKEWEQLKNNNYQTLSSIEKYIPCAFIFFYSMLILYCL